MKLLPLFITISTISCAVLKVQNQDSFEVSFQSGLKDSLTTEDEDPSAYETESETNENEDKVELMFDEYLVDIGEDEVDGEDGVDEDEPEEKVSTKPMPNILQIIYNTPELSHLASLIKERPAIAEALATTTNEITLFAPVNDAFKSKRPHPPSEDVLTQVLLYHVVEQIYPSETLEDGELLNSALELDTLGDESQKLKVSVSEQDTDANPIKINGHSRITLPDLQAVNGLVHLVDSVITPPPNLMWMLVHSIRDYAAFVLALKRTGLDKVVEFQKPGILFAPTNTAFKKIPVSKLAFLFSPAGSAQLTLLLLGHISPFLLYSQDIITHPQPLVMPTLGAPIALSVDKEGGITINGGDASVVKSDLCASNGVIHGIDSVLGEEGVGKFEQDKGDFSKEDWYQAVFNNRLIIKTKKNWRRMEK